jgi:general secretion pathway protein A
MLLKKMDCNVKSALITNTHLSPRGVLSLILEDFGVPYKNASKEKLLILLNEYLLQQMQNDQNVILLIDEAQNLSPACLEEVRMLSNLETEKEKLIQIILIGQPELKKKLELPVLTQLSQRVSVYYHLDPLRVEDTKRYIVHRLNLVRANGRDYFGLFTEEAIQAIYKISKGIPRVINNLCDHALLTGFVSETRSITDQIVSEASRSVLKS